MYTFVIKQKVSVFKISVANLLFSFGYKGRYAILVIN